MIPLKPKLSPITWKIGTAFLAVAAMYLCALFGIPFPDGLSTIVGLSVGFMFRDPETRGWRGMMGALMFALTMAIWIVRQTLYQEALLGMAFGNLYRNGSKGGEDDEAAEPERAEPVVPPEPKP